MTFKYELELALIPRKPQKPAGVSDEDFEESLDQLARIFNSGRRDGTVVYDPESKIMVITYPNAEVHTFVDWWYNKNMTQNISIKKTKVEQCASWVQ